MKLNKKAFGLATGILWGATVLLATIFAMIVGGGEHLALLSKFFVGYNVSTIGAAVGLVWGFVDGYIGGWLLAWLYNKFAG